MLRIIIVITFLEAFVTALVERGVAFYAENELGFTQSQNLWLALLFGTAYVTGALTSHRAAKALGERRWLLINILAHVLFHLTLSLEPGIVLLFTFNTLLGAVSGSKWPVVESYVSAGMTPRQAGASVGQFNIAWAFSAIPAVAIGGVLIETRASSLFLLPGILNIGVLLLIMRLPARPKHLPHDHPHRPTDGQIVRLRSLLISSRWSMFGSFTLLFLLAPMLPYIFKQRLGFSPGPATAMVSLIDIARFATFVLMQRYVGWHGRRSVLIGAVLLMPVGFLGILLSDHLAGVLFGEVLFGAASGMSYYAALYYAMVVKNAAVEAGGAHEGLIGTGFIVGPMIGLGGVYLSGPGNFGASGMLITITPLLIIFAVGGLWPLRGASKGDHLTTFE